MKVNESFAVEATEEVRKDPRFEWYVNWLKSLENKKYFSCLFNKDLTLYGITVFPSYHCGDWSTEAQLRDKDVVDEIITLDEVYSRYGKEIYKANGIEQPSVGNTDKPFQGSMDYDEKLLSEFWEFFNNDKIVFNSVERFLNDRYQNESILKRIAEKEAKIAENEAEIEELEKQLR